MDPLAGVEFVRGDLREQEVFDRILAALPEREVGRVLSDMAARVLKGGADALIKVFRGTGLQELIQDAHGRFAKVKLVEPAARRSYSPENVSAGQGFSLGVACWRLDQVREYTDCRVPADEAAFEDE